MDNGSRNSENSDINAGLYTKKKINVATDRWIALTVLFGINYKKNCPHKHKCKETAKKKKQKIARKILGYVI